MGSPNGPNGRWIAFERISNNCCHGPATRDRLFKVRADGTHVTLLSERLACDNVSCPADDDPAWSPSGRQIAFDRTYVDSNGDIDVGLFVMRADGSHVHQITEKIAPTRFEDVTPMWSPNGSHLVFQRTNKTTGKIAVFTVRRCGGHARRLTPWYLDAGGDPDWSPNGRWILFQSHEPHDRKTTCF